MTHKVIFSAEHLLYLSYSCYLLHFNESTFYQKSVYKSIFIYLLVCYLKIVRPRSLVNIRCANILVHFTFLLVLLLCTIIVRQMTNYRTLIINKVLLVIVNEARILRFEALMLGFN